MNTVVQLHRKEGEEEKKAVSWAKQWAWKEGEEEKTQSKRLAWKRKRAKLKAATMNRTKAEEDEYAEMQTRWIFDVLKEQRCAKYIILACSTSEPALSFLQGFLQKVDIPFETVAQALESFRDNKTITLESIMQDEGKQISLLSFWRVKAIRENFTQPQLLSSTDSGEERRGQAAARTLEDEGMVDKYAGLPAELQKLVANFTSRHDPQDSDAAAAGLRDGATDESEAPTIHPASSSEQHHREGNDTDEHDGEEDQEGESGGAESKKPAAKRARKA